MSATIEEVTTHGRIFPFKDNLTTFIVASDLSEAQSERLRSSLSLKGAKVAAHAFDAVRTVLMELFFTPKSSMENPSLRVNKHGGSTSKTFIVEDYTEDGYGRWATDEATGEHGHIDDERSCFLDMGRQRLCLAVQTIQEPPSEKKRQSKRKRQSWIQRNTKGISW